MSKRRFHAHDSIWLVELGEETPALFSGYTGRGTAWVRRMPSGGLVNVRLSSLKKREKKPCA